MGSSNPSALAGGSFFIILGAAILYFGLKTPEDKKVNIGFGRYLDRYGIWYTAITLLIVGLVSLVLGSSGKCLRSAMKNTSGVVLRLRVTILDGSKVCSGRLRTG